MKAVTVLKGELILVGSIPNGRGIVVTLDEDEVCEELQIHGLDAGALRAMAAYLFDDVVITITIESKPEEAPPG